MERYKYDEASPEFLDRQEEELLVCILLDTVDMSIPMIFVCGGTNFNGPLKGYEGLRVNCPRCHNNSVMALKKREFFTFCFVPVIPTNYGKTLQCTICPYSRSTSDGELEQLKNHG
ncbi:hypothetical protein BZA70DRAFT_275080 [Myxozyma melibiosi]|uniref:Zinc-ribbon 15 domain-containing protein n=1 Tax=Myxozyma melibiosi TaxID=54550 RepID=A0ABR1FCB2_9ASCO